nr:aldo/keto reductase [Oribacterium sp. NK2B42]
MKYTKLGNSDLNVSRICMGCMGFGDATRGQHSWTIDEEHSREIIKKGLDLGVNFYDTAIAYQSGTSEQYVGRALRDFAKREDVVVATKLHHIEGAANAVDIELTDDELKYLEEPYVPHPLAGVMAQNKRTDTSKKHVWSIGDQKIEGGKE